MKQILNTISWLALILAATSFSCYSKEIYIKFTEEYSDSTLSQDRLDYFLSRNPGEKIILDLSGAGEVEVKSNIEINENFFIDFGKHSTLKVLDGIEFRMFGYISAEPREIFDGEANFQGSISNGTILPEWFGAKSDYYLSDGSINPNPTNNSKAIQDAINCSQNQSDPTTVAKKVLLSGSYFINEAIKIVRANQAISISGEGKGMLITDLNSFHIKVEGDSINNNMVKHVKIHDLIFKGGKGISVSNSERILIENNMFAHSEFGIYLNFDNGSQDIEPFIINNYFLNNSVGIKSNASRVADATIHGNTFKNVSAFAIHLGYLDGGVIRDNRIFNELDQSISSSGIYIGKPIWTNIDSNFFFELNGKGLYLTSPRNTKVTNNTFVNVGKLNAQPSIVFKKFSNEIKSENNSILNNTIDCPFGNAIHLELSSQFNRISNNTIQFKDKCNSSRYQYAILHYYLKDSIISNNFLSGGNISQYWLVAAKSSGLSLSSNIVKEFINNRANLFDTSLN